MGSSYLYSGVKVNCTMMTNGKPLQLGANRPKLTVVTKGKHAIILNIDDKKISDTFSCKQAGKFWGGLEALCVGIAIGALAVLYAVAVVATAGTLLIATAVIVAGVASVVGIGAGVTGLYKQAHDCDCTLKSQWLFPHKTVKINGSNAVLLRSYIKCNKGGIVQPFINDAIAQEAADKFSKNNNEEINVQMESQFAVGVVAMAATLGDPAGIVLTTGFVGYEYVSEYSADEEGTEDEDKETAIGDAERDNITGTVVSAGMGTKESIEVITEQNKSIIKEVMEQGGSYETADALTVFGEKTFAGEMTHTGIMTGAGLGAGLLGSFINYKINMAAKDKKKELLNEVKAEDLKLTHEDSNNNFGVVANQ